MTTQYALPFYMEMLSNKRAKAVGSYGEDMARLALENAGYTVSYAHEKEKRGDLLIMGKRGEIRARVEVKTARLSAKLYRFSLERNAGRHCTSLKHADILILLCATKSGAVVPFVIPISVLNPGITYISIPGDPHQYAGKYAQFRQSFHAITLGELCPHC